MRARLCCSPKACETLRFLGQLPQAVAAEIDFRD